MSAQLLVTSFEPKHQYQPFTGVTIDLFPPHLLDGTGMSTTEKHGSDDAFTWAAVLDMGRHFWDTEMYLLPFFLYTDPAKARTLVDFRLQTLAGAQRNAANDGYSVAHYPWEADAAGNECTPLWQYRDHEVHVMADVAYALAHFAAAADPAYLAQAATAIVEMARYWQARIDWRAGEDHPSLLGMMGPDEYTPLSSNNAYTIQIAACGVHWQIAVFDFAGMCTALQAEALTLQPRLPRQWSRVAFLVMWHGCSIHVEVTRTACTIVNRGAVPLPVAPRLSESRGPRRVLLTCNCVWGREEIIAPGAQYTFSDMLRKEQLA